MVQEWVKKITEDVFGTPLKIGDVLKTTRGKTIKITDGQYYGTYGISNYWYYKEVLANGKLGREKSGYGWQIKEQYKKEDK